MLTILRTGIRDAEYPQAIPAKGNTEDKIPLLHIPTLVAQRGDPVAKIWVVLQVCSNIATVCQHTSRGSPTKQPQHSVGTAGVGNALGGVVGGLVGGLVGNLLGAAVGFVLGGSVGRPVGGEVGSKVGVQ